MDIAAKVLMSLGLFFFLGTSLGLLRLPDFYTRMHAAGKGDTLSSLLFLFGCACVALEHGHFSYSSWFVAVKILLIAGFIYVGSPTATHAIMNAGYKMKVPFWSKEKKKK